MLLLKWNPIWNHRIYNKHALQSVQNWCSLKEGLYEFLKFNLCCYSIGEIKYILILSVNLSIIFYKTPKQSLRVKHDKIHIFGTCRKLEINIQNSLKVKGDSKFHRMNQSTHTK